MPTATFLFVLIGVSTATSWLFKLLDIINR